MKPKKSTLTVGPSALPTTARRGAKISRRGQDLDCQIRERFASIAPACLRPSATLRAWLPLPQKTREGPGLVGKES